jgi:hypothetical protein
MTTALPPAGEPVSPPNTEPGPTITEPAQVHIRPHPAASLFPLLDSDELTELTEDIRVNGLQNPIVLDRDGLLLDGRNRWAAIQTVGIPCPTLTYIGDDPVGFVLSQNLHRRHLTDKRRAEIAATLATNQHGGDRRSIKSPNGDLKPTQAQAAALLNVSKRSVERAVAATKASEDGDSPKSEQEETPEKPDAPTPTNPSPAPRRGRKLRGHSTADARRTDGVVRVLKREVDRLRPVVPASLREHSDARRWRQDLGEVTKFLRGFARGLGSRTAPKAVSSDTAAQGAPSATYNNEGDDHDNEI